MLALCAQVVGLRHAGIYTSLRLPEDRTLARLFGNTNWAHLIDPRQYDATAVSRASRLAATQFKSPSEQRDVVSRVVRSLLDSLKDIERAQFAAFEWAIHEITDNVLVHSQSQVGGFIQVSVPRRDRNIIEFDVCDPGLGIPRTLREGHPELRSDAEALDRAIREGITRNPEVGQGNGLYGTYQVCSLSGGEFQICSGWANLVHSADQTLRISEDQIPYSGTVVMCRVDFTEKGVLEKALKFGGLVHQPVDYIDTHYVSDEGRLVLRLCKECSSFGSRAAAAPVRQRLENLMRFEPNQRAIIDFGDIPLVSSSFADELIGKLFVGLGPITFMQRVEIRNTNQLVTRLIDRAVMQRSSARTGGVPDP
jgi:anti-sigma regulatory factor (Ser/Thr protein kinase)